jgi:hypothetical protein
MDAEPPYNLIRQKMRERSIAYVLGAGAAVCGRQQPWTDPYSPCFPLGPELADYLARHFGLNQFKGSLGNVCSLINRQELDPILKRVFDKQLTPTPLHLCIASQNGHQLVITTNYDSLMEKAFESRQKPYMLLVYQGSRRSWRRAETLLVRRTPDGPFSPCRPDEVELDLDSSSVLFKLHGTADLRMIISEEDYFDLHTDIARNLVFPPPALSGMLWIESSCFWVIASRIGVCAFS